MKPTIWTLPSDQRSTFIPLGCLHWPIGEKDLLQKWVKTVKEAENGWTLLMGDTCDVARTHYRKHMRSYLNDENSQLALDEWHKREVVALAKVLEPIKHRIAGSILGNHYWEYSDGINSEQFLCQLLGIPYLGPAGVIRIEYREKKGKGDVRGTHVLFAHHDGGSSGGRTMGGDINALTRVEQNIDADIFVLSHTHKKYAIKLPQLALTSKGTPRLRERPRVMIRSGCLLKGYKEDHPSPTQPHFPTYAEKAAYRPTALGWVTCFVDWEKKHRRIPGSRKHVHTDYIPEFTLSF